MRETATETSSPLSFFLVLIINESGRLCCSSLRPMYGTSESVAGPRPPAQASSRFLFRRKVSLESNGQMMPEPIPIVRLPVLTQWQGVGECERQLLRTHVLCFFSSPCCSSSNEPRRFRCSSLWSLYGTSKCKCMAGPVIQGAHAGPAQASSRFPCAGRG